MTQIRTKLQAIVGLNPPSWVNDGNLGYASTNPLSIMKGLDLITFSSSSVSYYQVIFDYLIAAHTSYVLNSLFMYPLNRTSNVIEIVMSKDMYSSSTDGSLMIKFVKALLAAGEKAGKIALPTKTSVAPNLDNRGVIITFNM